MPVEAWLSGPVSGIDPHLMPVAHALLQARSDLAEATQDLTAEQLWARPGGAASVGFHLRHIPGSIDRLLTYARDEALTEEQRSAAAAEGAVGPEQDARPLLTAVSAAIDVALAQLRHTAPEILLEPRAVGRARLPSTVLGLLVHVAEHTQRHTGQVIATAKVVRAKP
jgi:uncharacterized damage-inducible protein DinB